MPFWLSVLSVTVSSVVYTSIVSFKLNFKVKRYNLETGTHLIKKER